MRRLRVPDDVAALIRGMHPELRRKVRAATDEILADANAGKVLGHGLAGLRSFRVGRIRIVYRRSGKGTVEIVAVGRRAVIYAETLQLLQKAKKP